MSPKSTAPLASVPATSNVTPEMALDACDKVIQEESRLQKVPGWAVKGARATNAKNAGMRIANALGELNAARELAARLESEMAPLVKAALDAIAGVPAKSTGPGPSGTSDKPTPTVAPSA